VYSVWMLHNDQQNQEVVANVQDLRAAGPAEAAVEVNTNTIEWGNRL
jgi:hypothetical protein